MSEYPAFLVGYGSDGHEIRRSKKPAKPLVMGGKVISTEHTPVSHSDGDAVYHAVTNALLLAIGERDIGYHFPDTDSRFEGAKSELFVKQALKLVEKAGYAPNNITVMVTAAEPKINPHIEEMKKNLSALLGIAQNRIGIGASRGEGSGSGEALGVHAVAQVSLARR